MCNRTLQYNIILPPSSGSKRDSCLAYPSEVKMEAVNSSGISVKFNGLHGVTSQIQWAVTQVFYCTISVSVMIRLQAGYRRIGVWFPSGVQNILFTIVDSGSGVRRASWGPRVHSLAVKPEYRKVDSDDCLWSWLFIVWTAEEKLRLLCTFIMYSHKHDGGIAPRILNLDSG
jgi:hypothetical protein